MEETERSRKIIPLSYSAIVKFYLPRFDIFCVLHGKNKIERDEKKKYLLIKYLVCKIELTLHLTKADNIALYMV